MNTLGEKLVGLDRKELINYINNMNMNIEITPEMTNIQICIKILDYKEEIKPMPLQSSIDEVGAIKCEFPKTFQYQRIGIRDFLKNNIGILS